jgi:prepilin-type processing-associated H-X9-DG protein
LNWQNFGDFYPVTIGPPPSSTANQFDVTFQVVPQEKANYGLAQTGHRSGMQVALCDGSVRTLAGGMEPTTYWAAVTPASGDVPGSDW